MTYQHPRPDNGFRWTTDTTAGRYVERAKHCRGLSLANGIRVVEWWEGEVWFVRDADDVEEFAWRSSSQVKERNALALAKMEAGRRTKALARGVRLEWADDRKRGAERLAKHKAAELAKSIRAAAPDLLTAAKAIYEAMPAPSTRKLTEAWDLLRAAIEKAEGGAA